MKDAYYFPHDSNAQNDPNIIKLIYKHGWAGYGLYWAIVEKLRNEPDYTMETDYEMIGFALRSDENVIKSIIEDFDLFEVKNNVFYSISLKRRMIKLDEIREKRSYAGKMSGISRNKTKPKQNKNKKGTSVKQVLNSKGNKSIENNSKKKNITNKHCGIDFELFWNKYNLKIDRPACEKIWMGKNKNGVVFDDDIRQRILNHLELYVEHTNLDGNYPSRKNPKTYLNNNCWEDDVIIPKPKNEGIIQWN